MSNNPSSGKVLFITSMPASRSNALGIQTMHLAEPFAPEWTHCYWYNHRMGESEVPNSHRLNTPIPYQWPFVTGRGFITRTAARLGLGWWRGDQLIESKKARLRRILGDIRFAYAAPIKNSDATKCREILETVGCPFVVHVWDFLDEGLNADYSWLFSHAEHVFCVSATMIEEICATASCETSLLPFTRSRSQYQAKHLGADTLRIGLIGTLFTYPDGLELLSRAIGGLRGHFANICVKYVGPRGQLEFIPDGLKGLTEYAGFPDDDGRDKALAECNVAYLPGPNLPPEEDARSRHSVPSRSADFTAIGLPMIAAVHPRSATNAFFSPIRGRGFFLVRDPEDICRVARELQDETFWAQAAHECASFFDKYFNKEHAQSELRSVAGRFI